MTDKTDGEKLLESWKGYFEERGFSQADAGRAAEIAAGPTVVAEAREAQGETGLQSGYRAYFESRGAGPQDAQRMAEVAGHADRGLVGLREQGDNTPAPLEDLMRRFEESRGPGSDEVLLRESRGSPLLGRLVLEV